MSEELATASVYLQLEAADLHAVRPAHYAIHERLRNWAGYVRDRKGKGARQPMFRHYRPYLVPREPGGEAPDSLDAMKVEREISFLPEKHAYAVRWCYVFPWRNEHRVLRTLAVQRSALCELIHDSRAMLKNRLEASSD